MATSGLKIVTHTISFEAYYRQTLNQGVVLPFPGCRFCSDEEETAFGYHLQALGHSSSKCGAQAVSIPVMQNFGLLFRNVFPELNLSATDITTIININSATGLFLGLFNGPLLKIFGYRKLAFIGAFLTWLGFLMTGFANSMAEFIIFYGIVNSLGMNILLCSFSLALNTYFVEKRNIASGFCATITGLGPVVMPLLISTSMEYYGPRGTALLMAGLLLHSFVAASLLQPVEWHYKVVAEMTELELLDESSGQSDRARSLKMPVDIAIDHEPTTPNHVLDGPAFPPRRVSLVSDVGINQVVVEADSTWWSSKGSIDDLPKRKRRRTTTRGEDLSTPELGGLKLQSNKPSSFCSKLVKWFDLDLLKDPIYFNIWIGTSIAFTGEINFSLLTPIILGERNFSINETAVIMSTIGTADIVFRFVSPFIGDYFKIPARQMYMISLVMLAVSRFSLTLVTGYSETLAVTLGYGVAKGFRSVYMSLVIPNYVSLDKLASANGLQTLLNGTFLFVFGFVIGLLRDWYGSYDIIIYLTNVMSLVTVFLWTIELVIVSCRKNHDAQKS